MKTYNRNVDILSEFKLGPYKAWPRSTKRIDTIIWMPCVAYTEDADFPDVWVSLLSKDGKSIYEKFPKGDVKKRQWQVSECNRKLLRVVYASILPNCKTGNRQVRKYRFLGLFMFDRTDAEGVHYRKIEA